MRFFAVWIILCRQRVRDRQNPFRQTLHPNGRPWMWSGIFKWIDRVTDLRNWPLQKTPWHTIVLFVGHFKILHKHCLHFVFGVKMAPRETENNAYAKFWDDKQRALWCVMVFSVVVNRAFQMTSRQPYWCSKTIKWRPRWYTKTTLWELNYFLT